MVLQAGEDGVVEKEFFGNSAREDFLQPPNSAEVITESGVPTRDNSCEGSDDAPSDELRELGEGRQNPLDDKSLQKPDKVVACPRCDSLDTKFCYYNNYNVNQPRHFCKNCQRYWTAGGTLRNVPVGAGRRKNKHGGLQRDGPEGSVISTLQCDSTESTQQLLSCSLSSPNSQKAAAPLKITPPKRLHAPGHSSPLRSPGSNSSFGQDSGITMSSSYSLHQNGCLPFQSFSCSQGFMSPGVCFLNASFDFWIVSLTCCMTHLNKAHVRFCFLLSVYLYLDNVHGHLCIFYMLAGTEVSMGGSSDSASTLGQRMAQYPSSSGLDKEGSRSSVMGTKQDPNSRPQMPASSNASISQLESSGPYRSVAVSDATGSWASNTAPFSFFNGEWPYGYHLEWSANQPVPPSQGTMIPTPVSTTFNAGPHAIPTWGGAPWTAWATCMAKVPGPQVTPSVWSGAQRVENGAATTVESPSHLHTILGKRATPETGRVESVWPPKGLRTSDGKENPKSTWLGMSQSDLSNPGGTLKLFQPKLEKSSGYDQVEQNRHFATTGMARPVYQYK